MKDHNITSGSDYAILLITTLLESQYVVSEEYKLDSGVLKNLSKRIHEYANFTWEEYIKENRETYLFSEDEVEEIYHKAQEDTVSELIEGLIDKELVSIKGINENGEFLYGLTEKGEEVSGTSKSKTKKRNNGKSNS
jgi:hypothetical protein